MAANSPSSLAFSRLAPQIKGLWRKDTSVIVAGNIVTNLARLASTIILTRILSSADFGVVGLVTSTLYIFVMLSDLGFYAYVVRHSGADDPRFLDEVWTLRLLRGIALSALIAIFAGPIAGFFEKPELSPVIAVAGLTIALDCATSMAFATAARGGLIRRITTLDVVPVLLTIPFTIGMAIWLQSYWAIIAGSLAGAVLKIVLSYAIFPASRRRWALSAARARDLWGFGRYVAGASLLHLLITQADKVVLARLFPLAEFGLYILAWNLAQIPGNLIASYSSRILYPLFARTHAQSPERLADVYYGSGLPMRFLYMVVCGGFIACAPFVIELLYDDRYLGAAFYLQLLALALVFKLSILVAVDALVAAGHVKFMFRLAVVRAVCLAILGVPLFFLYGPIGLVVALVGIEYVAYFYCLWALRGVGILRLRRELYFVLAALLGYGLGVIVNGVGTRLIT